MKNTDKVFAKRIKTAMKKKGLNKITLAPLIDDACTSRVTETWISGANYPHGERLKRLGKILFPYGLDYLFGFIDEPNLDNKTAAEYTGLSPEAIEYIRNLPQGMFWVLNAILTNEETQHHFIALLGALDAAIQVHDIVDANEKEAGHELKNFAFQQESTQYRAFKLADEALLKIENTIPIRGSSIWDRDINKNARNNPSG